MGLVGGFVGLGGEGGGLGAVGGGEFGLQMARWRVVLV